MDGIQLNPLELWQEAIGWTLIGIAFVKLLVLDRQKVLNKEFKWRYWLVDNTVDVLTGVVLTLITLKLGQVIFQLLGTIGIDFNGVVNVINSVGLDPIQISLVLAIVFQWWLYKRKLKKDSPE